MLLLLKLYRGQQLRDQKAVARLARKQHTIKG